MFKKILLTTDLSELSLNAFAPALELARKFDATILLAHIGEFQIPPLYVEYTGFQFKDMIDEHQGRAREELRGLAEQQLEGYAKVEPVVAIGSPHEEIVDLAVKKEVDMIVMATHGRGFMAHALLGSTTERVLRHAPCPVLAIRVGKR